MSVVAYCSVHTKHPPQLSNEAKAKMYSCNEHAHKIPMHIQISQQKNKINP